MSTNKTEADRFEEFARAARRRADIAKHQPIPVSEIDAYGDEVSQDVIEAQPKLFDLALQAQKAYCNELSKFHKIIRTLRAEALYWRQKYEDETIAKIDKVA